MRYKNYEFFNFVKFAEDLHQKRWGRGLTMDEAAQLMNKSKATISRWEASKTVPTVSDFVLCCYIFELSPMDYFVYADEM